MKLPRRACSTLPYWFTHYGWLYISLITDAYSKRVMGYGVAQTLHAIHCKAALQMALELLPEGGNIDLIHHSDRGFQYCSAEYVGLLNAHGVQISMTENSDPRENAIAERLNGILKSEYLEHQSVASLAQAQTVLQRAIYNYERPHLSCDMLVPDVAHKGEGKLNRRWRNYYHKKLLADILVNDERG